MVQKRIIPKWSWEPQSTDTVPLTTSLPDGSESVSCQHNDDDVNEGVSKRAELDKEAASCKVSLHPLASHDGLIVQVVPPKSPADEHLDRTPCDIVLVIDRSSSMSLPAPQPPKSEGEMSEDTGMSILDLTKHAANTIIEALDAKDRLAIVTFSTQSEVVLELISMDPENKKVAREKVASMKPIGCTALWAGMRTGLEQFKDSSYSNDYKENVRSMMVLTDGQPQGPGSTPSDGFVSAMRRQGNLPAAIHTFGFGYALEPGLLQSIAESGGGQYCFIPDSSMLGTVFIHAVANLQSTFAPQASLTLTYPSDLGIQELGVYINQKQPTPVKSGIMELEIDLNHIQYGQSRDIYLPYTCISQVLLDAKADGHPLLHVRARLEYRHQGISYEETAERNICDDGTDLSSSEIAFHKSRARVFAFLSELFPLDTTGEHKPLKGDRIREYADLKALLDDLPANQAEHIGDARNGALVEDLHGSDMKDGQVEQALRTGLTQDHWRKWGMHYLPSLMTAHTHQTRMSFNDPGTQTYGANSPLFLQRLAALNDAFDRLPPPEPSQDLHRRTGLGLSRPVNMSAYNDPRSTCFAGQTRVLLAPCADRSTGNGEKKTVAIQQLRRGMAVETLKGPRTVRTVLKCHTNQTYGQTMYRLPTGSGTTLCVTEWHPVSLDNGASWIFPYHAYPADDYPAITEVGFKEPVYSVLLQRRAEDDHADAHSINVDGIWGVTMGHGLVEAGTEAQKRDVRTHPFYGDYDVVAARLDALPEQDGQALAHGTTTSEETGLSNGFIPFDVEQNGDM